MIDAWYPIIYFVKGKPRKLNQRRNWFLLNTANTSRNKDNPKTESIHETPKNIDIIRHIIKCHSKDSNIILDPFMGSGTTLIAAKELKRRAVGIEISEKYCEVAVKRLKNTIVPMF